MPTVEESVTPFKNSPLSLGEDYGREFNSDPHSSNFLGRQLAARNPPRYLEVRIMG